MFAYVGLIVFSAEMICQWSQKPKCEKTCCFCLFVLNHCKQSGVLDSLSGKTTHLKTSMGSEKWWRANLTIWVNKYFLIWLLSSIIDRSINKKKHSSKWPYYIDVLQILLQFLYSAPSSISVHVYAPLSSSQRVFLSPKDEIKHLNLCTLEEEGDLWCFLLVNGFQ